MNYKRVLIKLSGEAMMGKEKTNKVLNKDTMYEIANQIKTLVENDVEIGIVIGGGNIFRGNIVKNYQFKELLLIIWEWLLLFLTH